MDPNVKITAYSNGEEVYSRTTDLSDYYDGDMPEIDVPEYIMKNKIDMVEISKYDGIFKNYYNEKGVPVRFETYDKDGTLLSTEEA